MNVRFASLALAAVALTGCYHATVETGRAPSAQTISNQWASGWVYGLVPPKAVETASKCPSGVSKVDTQLSFPNMLVSYLTFGIYTPMSIVVTCAAPGGGGGGSSDAATLSGKSDPAQAVAAAAALSLGVGEPAFVKF